MSHKGDLDSSSSVSSCPSEIDSPGPMDLPKFKIVVIGPPSAGKNALIHRFVTDRFLTADDHECEVGVSFMRKTVAIPPGVHIMLKCHDRAMKLGSPCVEVSFDASSGDQLAVTTDCQACWLQSTITEPDSNGVWAINFKEDLISMMPHVLHGASGAVIVYDNSNDEESNNYTEVHKMLNLVHDIEPGIPVAFAASKSDLGSAISDNGATLFHSFDSSGAPSLSSMNPLLGFYPTSALTGDGVWDVFLAVAEAAHRKTPGGVKISKRRSRSSGQRKRHKKHGSSLSKAIRSLSKHWR
ncbi:hypothetical protein FOL47_005685 [Perkinsus chesapeaki]|uniref:Uncharacterized protein n=1 Tax=Perkinsus chesapeaki TaxID=330153 RepID=A0A7J6LWL1_PERCH|nr:hypothetical protein FOL47_005685 [Perkinsus chesapeaki]